MFVSQKLDIESNKMLNQAAMEAMYSAVYIEDYIDFIENVPDDIQRNLTQLRELDLSYQEILQELEKHEASLKKDLDVAHRRTVLFHIQRALIASQELGDKKLQIVQAIQDIIDNKSRQLEVDRIKLAPKPVAVMEEKNPHNTRWGSYKEIRFSAEDYRDDNKRPEYEKPAVSSKRGRLVSTSIDLTREIEPPSDNSKSEAPERPSKRSRRQRHLDLSLREESVREKHEKEITTPIAPKTKKKKKRKAKAEKEPDNSPVDPLIDPNEPTYCLCDQVSYGEMIGCDNDGCEKEWFHFSCVGLTTKPKGKWYCPNCRGDRCNQMRPKTV